MGLIQINKHLIALTSNKYITRGEDKLVIYDLNSLKIQKEINNFSFNNSSNGLAILISEVNKEEDEKDNNDMMKNILFVLAENILKIKKMEYYLLM